MEFRNAKYSKPDNSMIDMEINHPVYGWIPFSATKTDTVVASELFEAAKGSAVPYVAQQISPAQVDAERDRRIALGFTWSGKTYQSRQFDLDNIRSMGAAATAMIAQGQVDTGYRWFDAAQDFVWIAADNTLTPMSASDMIDFALAAAVWVKDNIFAASAIKATAGGIPADYAANARWPNAPAS